jgi:aspartyl-tRNA(Asn)/glutamyl-tRNA(Gln) amidotransferase subunit A
MTDSTAELAYATVAELGRAIRSGAVSPTELTTFFLNRLDTVGRSLNAVATLTPERAMAAARKAEDELIAGVDRGPLHGIPYGAKDLLATADYPTSWGAAPLRDQRFDHDAEVIRRLDDAGAVLVGKLSMVELAGGFGYEQPDAAFNGPGICAWGLDSWAGGSSSGSGSAVAAGCVPFAIGTETWGSILCPSSFNGLTGLRPSYGLVSRAGAMALSWTMDKIGPMCHTAGDCDLVLRAIAESDRWTMTERSAGPFRLGVLAGSGAESQPDVATNFAAALDALADFANLEEVSLPSEIPWDTAASVVIMAEAASAFEEFIISGESQGLTAPEDRVGLHHALALPAVDYLRALRIRRKAMRALDETLTGFDAIVAPTMPYVAIPLTDRFDTWFGRERGPSLGAAGNLCGVPSITVMNGFGERGLPTGLEFMGRAGSERVLIELAEAYQSATSWHDRHPHDSLYARAG